MWTKIPCVFGTGFYKGGRAEKPLAYACERCKTSTLLAGWRPELWKSFQRHRWADDVFWIEGRKSSPALFKPVSHFEWIFSEQQFLGQRASLITKAAKRWQPTQRKSFLLCPLVNLKAGMFSSFCLSPFLHQASLSSTDPSSPFCTDEARDWSTDYSL